MAQRKLKFKFDPNQDFQIEAVDSIVDLFEGMESQKTEFRLSSGEIMPNLPPERHLPEATLFDNVRMIQQRNKVQLTSMPLDLEVDEGLVLEGAGYESWRYPVFTIEMETGTGKTYVYLRTVYELIKRYGFGKFIIVVPSTAIYEGVIKNFEVTRSHFAALYDNEPLGLIEYDGAKLSQLRDFATSKLPYIMVMTIQSFNSIKNNLYKPSEKLPGELLPYQYIQQTRPILILDEPQSLGLRGRGIEALRTLHPLFAVQYSATHRKDEIKNLVYQLSPLEAYERSLVKKIQVDGVVERNNANQPFLMLESIDAKLNAKVKTYVDDAGRVKEVTLTLRDKDDLYDKTRRDEHKGQAYIVREINRGEGFIEFENNVRLYAGETIGPSRPEIFRVQIERTIEQHMLNQQEMLDQGIKVLSLFFIDRVANYVADNGIIRQLFDEVFDKLKRRFPYFAQMEPANVREAYFAKSSKKKSDEEEFIDTTGRNKAEREAERAAFQLIMRDKERLLSLDEPVSFIFAHSALKEGWDNPNVFQICTLNQTVSEMKKRQEIGRGLRLCVNQDGERVFDNEINVLTVVANESYSSFVSGLQTEYVEAGLAKPPAPTEVRRKPAKRNDAVLNSDDFKKFWRTITRRASYRIHVDTDMLVAQCAERINNKPIPESVIIVERGEYVVTSYELKLESVSGGKARIALRITDTTGKEQSLKDNYSERDDLAKMHKDDRLRGFKIVSIEQQDGQAKVIFGNGVELDEYTAYRFDSESGQRLQERSRIVPVEHYPVFNLLDRAAHATGLTRPTINRIFKALSDKRKESLLTNPEGFASLFITEVNNALADHIAETIEFDVDSDGMSYEIEELFPAVRSFAQRELLEADDRCLYDQVQVDSGVEEVFVNNRLKPDPDVVMYFKFPPAFKISFPKIIGNYNPDWGIVRRDEDGSLKIQIVCETKGKTDVSQLRFAHEKRKVRIAEKYFETVGLLYLMTDGEDVNWWRPATRPHQQLLDME